MTFAREMHELADKHRTNHMDIFYEKLVKYVQEAAKDGCYRVEATYSEHEEKDQWFFSILYRRKSRNILKRKLKPLGLKVSYFKNPIAGECSITLRW